MNNIITTLIIIILATGTDFAGNINHTSTSSNNQLSDISYQQLANTKDAISVTINDMNGKIIYSEILTTYDENITDLKLRITNKFAKGIYFIIVVVNRLKITKNLVVV